MPGDRKYGQRKAQMWPKEKRGGEQIVGIFVPKVIEKWLNVVIPPHFSFATFELFERRKWWLKLNIILPKVFEKLQQKIFNKVTF